MHWSYLGIALAVLAMFCFSVTYAIFKACSPYIPNTQIIFIQSLFSWIFLIPFVMRRGVESLKTEQFWLIATRTLFGLLGLLCITAALKTINLAEVVLLNNTGPLFVPLIVWLWHRTKISFFLGCSIIIGFAGVFLVLRPGFDALQMGMLLAALSGVFTALLLVVTKQIAGEPFLRIMFYYFLLWWILLSPFALLNWHPMPLWIWLFLIAAAISLIGAQWTFTAALRFAPSQEVAPLIYTTVIFSGLIGWIVWDEKIGLLSLIGMIIVCVGGILAMFTARKKA